MRNFSAVTSTREGITAKEAQALVDAFIHKHSPAWITGATAQGIARLRTLIAQHKATQDRLAEAAGAIQPLHAFALRKYSEALQHTLPAGQDLTNLEWPDKILETTGVSTPHSEFVFKAKPGLLRLMQNFAANATPLDGSGLYAPGTDRLLSGPVDALCSLCRELDVGRQYQTLLDKQFESRRTLLVDDKRKGFELAVQVALLRQHIDGDVAAALNACIGVDSTPSPKLVALPGLMSMLGHTVHEALFIQLRDEQDDDAGVVIYLPGQAEAPLRWYKSKLTFENQFVEQLRAPGNLASLLQSVGLATRDAFLRTLQLRLMDDAPDLAVEGQAGHGSVFERWVLSQLQRAKDDARLLLVPTAEADTKASRERVAAWVSAGWTVANLGGFFIPAVGALLLAQLLTHVCSQVFEGTADWAKGHDHEALEHLLNVAQAVSAAVVTTGAAVGAATAVRAFTRSAFVDSLDVVRLEDGSSRLWHAQLSPYASVLDGAQLNDRGLYSKGGQYWLRIDDRYYQVHQAEPDGTWRLVHPLRKNAFGPVVRYNGERYWHMTGESPEAWSDAAKMLGRLWPQEIPLDQQRARQVLLAADSDVDELRGILADNRALPANLRDTLHRFEVDQRIERFFASLAPGATDLPDPQLWQWCSQRLGIVGREADQVSAEIVEGAAQLRFDLFQLLTQRDVGDDRVVHVILRDFAGLPVDYARQLAGLVTAKQRDQIELLRKLPLPVTEQARALQQLARLNRARQGVLLRNAHSDEGDELAMMLLARLPNWPSDRRLELRARSSSGRLLCVLNPAASESTGIVMARRDGLVSLYDHRRYPLDVEITAPDDVFAAIAATLTPAQCVRLNLGMQDPAASLRERVVQTMPVERQALLNMLGWRAQQRWFNPGQRLADGRVGYPLGGSQSSERDLTERLRQRVAALYHGDSRAKIDDHLSRILESEDPFDTMIYEEENFQLLCSKLDAWIMQARASEKPARGRLAMLLQQAWRGQLQVDVQRQDVEGRILDMSGAQVTSLPALDERIDFHFITTLVMIGTPLNSVPEAFFSCFREVRRLNFSRNNLRVIPTGLHYMTRLDNLQLNYNRIRMDFRGQETLNDMSRLTSLNLAVNPLHTLTLRFAQVPALRRLDLRGCRLVTWPAGLEHCGLLGAADLRNNQLAHIPEEILHMPYAFRSALQVDGNAISASQWARLYQLPAHVEHLLQAVGERPDLLSARELWVSGAHAKEVGGYWDRLFATMDDTRKNLLEIFYRLRNTQDYQQHRGQLTLKVRALLAYIDEDPMLRDEILSIGKDPTACNDSIIERFSDMYLHALKSHASRSADGEEAGMLKLGLGLFRLSKLDEFIRMDMRSRNVPDAVETRLYYNVTLAKEFDLPGQPDSMIYIQWAHVSDDDIDAARTYVKAADTIDAQAQFLAGERFWCNWLEKAHAQAFADVTSVWNEKGNDLAEKEGTLTEDAYQLEWDEVEYGRLADEHQLTLLLTRQTLAAQTVAAPTPQAGPSS